MLVVHGGQAGGLEAAAGEMAEALGQEGRALGGGDADRLGPERACRRTMRSAFRAEWRPWLGPMAVVV